MQRLLQGNDGEVQLSPVELKNRDTAVVHTRQNDAGEWELSVDNQQTWHGPFKSEADAQVAALEAIDREVQRLLKHAFSF